MASKEGSSLQRDAVFKEGGVFKDESGLHVAFRWRWSSKKEVAFKEESSLQREREVDLKDDSSLQREVLFKEESSLQLQERSGHQKEEVLGS